MTAAHGAAPSLLHSIRTVRSMTQRYLLRILRLPALIVPTLIMPLFFVVAFTGSFSGIAQVDGYGTDNAYNWMAPYAIAQAGAFSGAGVGGALINDLDNGFFDRLLLSPGRRSPILVAAICYAIVRSLLPITLVVLAAVTIGNMSVPGGAAGIAMLYVQGISLAAIIGLLGAIIAFTFRDQRSMMLAQVMIFGFTFLSIGQVPITFLTGWLHGVARVNPMTNMYRLGRQGLLGDVSWALTWPGLLAIAGSLAVLAPIAFAQLRRLAP